MFTNDERVLLSVYFQVGEFLSFELCGVRLGSSFVGFLSRIHFRSPSVTPLDADGIQLA